MPSPDSHPNDPLHGVTLKTVLQTMVDRHGWRALADRIPIRCFMFDPSINSSLKFLRQTPWARKKLEDWFIYEANRNPPRP
ncbi:MAG: VF530 family DNA-binding protein [Verrucomicrobiota bacterium JB025]|nr:VF530 family protein [Verrucomicrobiota bacterium JB025]